MFFIRHILKKKKEKHNFLTCVQHVPYLQTCLRSYLKCSCNISLQELHKPFANKMHLLKKVKMASLIVQRLKSTASLCV